MSADPIQQLLDSLQDIHSCPAVVQRILSLTATDDYDVPMVASCLDHDPALAASILRLVNSPLYGLHRRIGGLDQAAMYLGRRSLRLAVLNFGLVNHFVSSTPARLFEHYWRHALTCASAARLTIVHLGRDRNAEDEAYSAGLLADLGVLVLAQHDPQGYTSLYLECPQHAELASAERRALGFDHAEVSARLMASWGFPAHVVEAIGEHHQFCPDHSMLQQTLSVASLMGDALWSTAPEKMRGRMEQLTGAAYETFGIDVDQFITLALACKDAYNDAKALFQLHLAGEMDVERVKREARRRFTARAFDAAATLDTVDLVADDAEATGMGVEGMRS